LLLTADAHEANLAIAAAAGVVFGAAFGASAGRALAAGVLLRATTTFTGGDAHVA
jgi:hypothetical protein